MSDTEESMMMAMNMSGASTEIECEDWKYSLDKASAYTNIRNLSEKYRFQYNELQHCFKEWELHRLKLLKTLKTSSYNLERNSLITSCLRIFASAADIIGTLIVYRGYSQNFFGSLLMENSSLFSILIFFIEKIRSRQIYAKVEKAIQNDQKSFGKLVKWFKQSEELNIIASRVIPRGIEKDVVKKISNDFEDYRRIFFAILLSNLKQNPKPFRSGYPFYSVTFLHATSAGRFLLYKVIEENDPCSQHILNASLFDDIKACLDILPREKQDLQMMPDVNVFGFLSRALQMKVILNLITIISIGIDLYSDAKAEKSKVLKKLLENSSEELENAKLIVHLLNPVDSPLKAN